MGKIIKLDKTLANQIAAGEVVERPVSIVKELVENSIDAGSTKITIEIEEGGTKKIIISDNGEGISKEDLKLIGEKHATSKIKNVNDLYNILTFGFRGEAISSISSVSNMEIQTKNIKENIGNSLKISFGEKGKISDFSRDSGTKIIIERLFENTPARLNYLKSSKTEYNHILNYLNEICLSYPEIGFNFISDGKTIFNYKEGENLKTRIYSTYSEDFYSNLLEINFETTGIKISGFISDPKISFQNKSKQAIFVNKRPIKSPLISKSINDAYNRFIPHSMNPGYVLNLNIDPTTIDVNVHPRKQEIRFENEQNIFRVFYHAIENKLNSVSLLNNSDVDIDETHNITQMSTGTNLENTSKNNKYYIGSGEKFKSYSPYKNLETNPSQRKLSDSIEFTKIILSDTNVKTLGRFCEDSNSENTKLSNDLHYTKLGKIIGQSHNSYIIVETKDGIKFFDQHALAERIIYEKLTNNDKKSQIQQLLIGESLILSPIETNFLNDNIGTFKQMGFDFEVMNGNIIINGIPDFIKKENVKNIFLGILDDIGISGMKKSKTLEEVKNKIHAYTACRSAIKFGHKLDLFEMNALLNDSIESYSSTCPHGRPVIFEIDLEKLKGKYER